MVLRRLPSLQYRARTLVPYCKPHGKKIAANPPQAFCTEKFTKCPTQYFPLLSCPYPRTLKKAILQYTVTQGIYVIISLSLQSNRLSLRRKVLF
jgi:diketogulonate reductase-like aldo/keto reductase